MRIAIRSFALTAGALALVAAACGSEKSAAPGSRGVDREAAWLDRLETMGLEPAQRFVTISVSGPGMKLDIILTLSPEAPAEVSFADGLYGATAYAFAGERWTRVDTAEIRTQIAPSLRQGESARFALPVAPADSYRVLVPVEGKASWGDSTG